MNIRSQKFKELQEFNYKIKGFEIFSKRQTRPKIDHTRSNDIQSFIIKWYFTAVLNVHKRVTENELDLRESNLDTQ